jgi:hypothetical protein
VERENLIRVSLADMKDAGLTVIDDFHRLDTNVQHVIADHLKLLADEERSDTKLIIIGINRVGDPLVTLAPDLNNRIDTIRLEANPDNLILKLIESGEDWLNIEFAVKPQLVRAATGSFCLAQMLCHETCIFSNVTEAQVLPRRVETSYQSVVYRVMEGLSRKFMNRAVLFAGGPRLSREGRAPYLHVLRSLAESEEWSIALDREVARHPELRGSAGQIAEKGYLANFMSKHPELGDIVHYEPLTTRVTVEDPQFEFFLRNLAWNDFATRVGFLNIRFSNRYDFALSFAGSDRAIAKRLFELLSTFELEVFYDENEQARILAQNIEDYLGPIYSSEAAYVIALMGPAYPKRIWTEFESKQFKGRLGKNAVIPIWFSNSPPGIFDESTRVGGLTFNPGLDHEEQLQGIVEVLRKKIADTHSNWDKDTPLPRADAAYPD